MKALKRLSTSYNKQLMYIYMKDINIKLVTDQNEPLQQYSQIILSIKRGKEKKQLVSNNCNDNIWTFKDKFSMISKFYLDVAGKA